MSGKATAVMWLGLILIGLNLMARWGEVKSVIFNGAGTSGTSGSGGKSASSGNITVNPPGQGVTVPVGGFPITVPL